MFNKFKNVAVDYHGGLKTFSGGQIRFTDGGVRKLAKSFQILFIVSGRHRGNVNGKGSQAG